MVCMLKYHFHLNTTLVGRSGVSGGSHAYIPMFRHAVFRENQDYKSSALDGHQPLCLRGSVSLVYLFYALSRSTEVELDRGL